MIPYRMLKWGRGRLFKYNRDYSYRESVGLTIRDMRVIMGLVGSEIRMDGFSMNGINFEGLGYYFRVEEDFLKGRETI